MEVKYTEGLPLHEGFPAAENVIMFFLNLKIYNSDSTTQKMSGRTKHFILTHGFSPKTSYDDYFVNMWIINGQWAAKLI